MMFATPKWGFACLFAALLFLAACSGSSLSSGDGDESSGDEDGDLQPADEDGDESPPDGDGDDENADASDGDIDGSDGDGEEDAEEPPCYSRCYTLSREELDFGAVLPGQSKCLDEIVMSTGIDPLTLHDIRIDQGTGTAFSIESIQPVAPPDAVLNPQHPMNVRLCYLADDLERDEATLLILTNADTVSLKRREVPMSVGCKGFMTMNVQPPALDYGEHNSGSVPQDLTFTIQAIPDEESTTCPLYVREIALDVPDGPFRLRFDAARVDGECPEPPFYIDPKEGAIRLTRECAVRFTPPVGASAEFSDTVSVAAIGAMGGDELTADVTLNATTAAPVISCAPTSLDFGYTLTDSGRTAVLKQIACTNNGDGSLILSLPTWQINDGAAFLFHDPDSLFKTDTTEGTPLGAGDSGTFQVSFEPTAIANATALLKVTSNDYTGRVESITMSGIAVDACPTGMIPDPTDNTRKCVPSCSPGQIFCWPEYSNYYRECQPDGASLSDPIECANTGQICVENMCQDPPCDPGERMCDDLNHDKRCSNDGTHWEEAEACPTVTNQCQVSECRPGTTRCQTYNREDGYGCDDSDACTLQDHCMSGQCISVVDEICDDGEDCTDDDCDSIFGCQFVPNDANPCTDNNDCTTDDHCQNGECVAGQSLYDCDDDNPCTDDICNPTGEPHCTYQPNFGDCNDNNPCTENDVCGTDEFGNGVCLPGPDERDCADTNPCTDDWCLDFEGCRHSPMPGQDCEDGNLCTINDSCGTDIYGHPVCQPGTTVDCDDDNDCTDDYCCVESPDHCCHTLLTGEDCNDEDVCTENDTCNELGQCVGDTKDCEDGNPCTDGYCHPTLGCLQTGNTADCEDGNPCTVDDYCQNQICRSGTERSCDDGNRCSFDDCDPDACTGDDCQPEDYCTHDLIPTVSECDGNPCTEDDTCTTNGQGEIVCIPGDSSYDCDDDNPCTEDTCDPTNPGDPCTNTPLVGEGCEDEDPCTINEYCNANSRCVHSGLPQDFLSCDDGNPCKNWYCQENVGCRWTAYPGTCSDNDPCTEGDYCSNGDCRSGSGTKECSDGNPCKNWDCDIAQNPDGGCYFTPKTGQACIDSDACTSNEICNADGVCEKDTVSCDPETVCAGDTCDTQCVTVFCDPAAGCTYSLIMPAPNCNDGNSCTGTAANPDRCINGLCVPGGTVTCDPETVCENGTLCHPSCVDTECAPGVGCRAVANDTYNCSDGTTCVTGDHCEDGFCVGNSRNCNDSNDCTEDDCLEPAGCENIPYDYPADNVSCAADANECTLDVCDAIGGEGVCDHKTAPMDGSDCTPDANECTQDFCQGGSCTHPPKTNDTPCSDDGNLCTADVCQGGNCSHPLAVTCTPPNSCYTSACVPATGQCDDTYKGDGPSHSCTDDENPCTEDYCMSGDCTHPALPDTAGCGSADQCQAGAPASACLDPAHEDDASCCVDCVTDAACSDLAWGEHDSECERKICTADFACDFEDRDDGTACGSTDQCLDGECVDCINDSGCSDLAWGGRDSSCSARVCNGTSCEFDDEPNGTNCPDDGNVCTTTTCANGACTAFPAAGGCNDGDPCTVNDSCSGGTCSGDPMTCPGGEICVDGSCVEDLTCPGHSDMVKIPGDTRCIDKYESVLCRTSNCATATDCKYQDSSNDYWSGWGSNCWWDNANWSTTRCGDTRPRACSLPGVTPSRWMTYDQARAACETAGKHLCSPSEWAQACTLNAGQTYPYGNAYQAATCNGNGDSVSGIANTGQKTACNYPDLNGPFDMSGNAREWVRSENGSGTESRYGGHYDSGAGDLTCGSNNPGDWDDKSPRTGMRCCIDY